MVQEIPKSPVQMKMMRSMLTAEMIFLMVRQVMTTSKVVQAMILTCLV